MTRTSRRRSRPRTRRTPVLIATGVVAGAIALGLAAAGTTTAALSTSQTMPGATITAGSLDLTVNGTDSAELGAYSMVPGAPQARAFTVTNTGTTAADLTTTIAVSSTEPIKESMRARVTAVADREGCVTNLAGAQGALDGFSSSGYATVEAGESVIVCLELSLLDTTPITQAGQSASFTATVTGTQRDR